MHVTFEAYHSRGNLKFKVYSIYGKEYKKQYLFFDDQVGLFCTKVDNISYCFEFTDRGIYDKMQKRLVYFKSQEEFDTFKEMANEKGVELGDDSLYINTLNGMKEKLKKTTVKSFAKFFKY